MLFCLRKVECRDNHARLLRSELGENVAALVADEAVTVEALAVLDADAIGESDPDHSTFNLPTTIHTSITRAVVARLPWKIVPFVIGVFIIVEVCHYLNMIT